MIPPNRLKSSKSRKKLLEENDEDSSDEDRKKEYKNYKNDFLKEKEKEKRLYKIKINEFLFIYNLFEFEKLKKRPKNEIKIYFFIKKEWMELFKDFFNCKKIYKTISKNIKNDIFMNRLKSDNLPDELLKVKAKDEKIPKELTLFKENEENTKNLNMENVSLSYYPNKLCIIEESMKNSLVIGNKNCNFENGKQGIIFKDTLYIIVDDNTLETFIFDDNDNTFDPVCLFKYDHKNDLYNDLNNKYKYKEIKQCLKELDFMQKKKPKYIRDDKKNVVGKIIYLLDDDSDEAINNFLIENNNEIKEREKEIKEMEEEIIIQREKEIKKMVRENKRIEKEKKEERKREREERKQKEAEDKEIAEKERLEKEEINKNKKLKLKLKRQKEKEKEKIEEEIRKKEIEERQQKEREEKERQDEIQKENERLEKERIIKEREEYAKYEKEKLENELKQNELKKSMKIEREKKLWEKIREETEKLEEEKNRKEKERKEKEEEERIKRENEKREKEEKERRIREEKEEKKRLKKKQREDERKRIREGFERLNRLEEDEKKKKEEQGNKLKKEIKERRQKEKEEREEKEKIYKEKMKEEKRKKEEKRRKEEKRLKLEEEKRKEEERRLKLEEEKRKQEQEKKIKEQKIKNDLENQSKKSKTNNNNNKNPLIESNMNPIEEEEESDNNDKYDKINLKNDKEKNDDKESNFSDDNKEPRIGLENIGSTCYMNATIQCLSKTVKLTNYFIDPKNKDKIFNNNIIQKNKNNLDLSSSYYELIQHLWDKKNKKGFYAPHNFKQKISQMNPLFQGYNAGDSKDLITFILMKLHEELNIIDKKNNSSIINDNQFDRNISLNQFMLDFKSENNSIISDLFYGIIENISECINCKNKNKSKGLKRQYKYNFQNINFLIFPLEEVRKYRNNKFMQINANKMAPNMMTDILNNNRVFIMDCFEYYQNPILMTGDNKMYCNVCKKMFDANYRTKIFYAPNIMILILDRGKNIKYNVGIDFLPSIDITQFVDKNYENGIKVEYDLYAVLTHIGESSENGHFIAFCKSHDYTKKWYCYNDANVTEIKDFISQVHNYGLPYILFYERI